MVSGIISIGIFLILQLIGAVAWASAINVKMSFMLKHAETFSNSKDTFSTKAEVATALVVVEKNTALAVSIVQKETAIALSSANKELEAMWKQIDILKMVK